MTGSEVKDNKKKIPFTISMLIKATTEMDSTPLLSCCSFSLQVIGTL